MNNKINQSNKESSFVNEVYCIMKNTHSNMLKNKSIIKKRTILSQNSVLQTGRVPGIKKIRSGYEYDCKPGPRPVTGGDIRTFRKF